MTTSLLDIEDLPPLFRELSEVVGEPAALALVSALPGLRLSSMKRATGQSVRFTPRATPPPNWPFASVKPSGTSSEFWRCIRNQKWCPILYSFRYVDDPREVALMEWNPLVPELVVQSYDRSKKFYIEILGFNLCFERLEDRFGYFDLNGAQVMLLEQPGADIYRMDRSGPNGKGLHFQVELDSISGLLSRLNDASVPLASKVEDAWYRAATITHGQREFFVADPDGYLYRFYEYLGERPV